MPIRLWLNSFLCATNQLHRTMTFPCGFIGILFTVHSPTNSSHALNVRIDYSSVFCLRSCWCWHGQNLIKSWTNQHMNVTINEFNTRLRGQLISNRDTFAEEWRDDCGTCELYSGRYYETNVLAVQCTGIIELVCLMIFKLQLECWIVHSTSYNFHNFVPTSKL